MIQKLRESKAVKAILMFALLNFLSEMFAPTLSLALTGGPSQPEVQQFTPVGTSDMVDLSSGDFNYNIPLMDVGGYPINIAYNSGVTMDQEASWVGLGWNINPGAINRSKRGLPDDFNGDVITGELNMKSNITTGISVGVGLPEVFGVDIDAIAGLSVGIGFNWNSYNGFFGSKTIGASFEFGKSNSLTAGIGLSASTNEGVDINPTLSYKDMLDNTKNVGISWNSRGGLKEVSIDNGRRLSGSLKFASSTYTPTIQFPMSNTSVSFRGKLGGDLFWTDITGNVSGYFSQQQLKESVLSSRAYGYLYVNKGQDNDRALLDFNREKDVSFVKGTPNLPISSLTNDLYSVSGQGVGGQFRAYHSSIGSIHDQKFVSTGIGADLGLEITGGNAFKAGGPTTRNYSESKSGKWRGNTNLTRNNLKFSNKSYSDDYENVYFRNIGDLSVDEEVSRFNSLGGFEPASIKLIRSGITAIATAKYKLNNGSELLINDNFSRTERVKRNQSISTIKAKDIQEFGLNSYTSDHSKPDHVGEITVNKTDGSRYVYGLPAYNINLQEVSFNVGATSYDSNDGLVTYDAGDNSTSNDKGQNHFYQMTETPAYSHAHLLTAVLSPDYQDYDDIRGPSLGDLGTYVKFDYDNDPGESDLQAARPNYKWRVPYQPNKASFNEGLKTLNGDNTGSYIYGEKEIWHLQKIETKTHIAIFKLSDRHDGYEVIDKNGGLNGSCKSQLKLDSIMLYARPDFEADGLSATPIKTVHFEYNYELCGNAKNNDGSNGVDDINIDKGKLTLKKLYFTYGDSERGRLSAYEFDYMEGNQNPDYNLKKHNMWGGYKPFTASDPVNNAEFPYVDQYDNLNDDYASAWSLKTIHLPSGGTIELEFESDDYAYVQNKRANQMFEVVNVTSSPSYTAASGSLVSLYDNNDDPNQYMWVRLLDEDATDPSFDAEDFKQKYLDRMENKKNVYFTFLMNMSFDYKEFVSGYAEIDIEHDYYGVDGGYGYIKIKNVKRENKNSGSTNSHPISKAAWQFTRIHLPQLLQETNAMNFDNNVDETSVIETLASMFSPSIFSELLSGPNNYVRKKNIGNRFYPDKSWVRLGNPNGKKEGGGSRVKSIKINDAWNEMTTSTHETKSYGQEYIYENDNGESSGVATYEPLISKENPFVQPVYFDSKKFLLPDDRYMLEKPYGASYFPAPMITYSKVTTKDIYPVKDNKSTLSERRTGKTVTSYYTTKDFPTITKQTNIQNVPLLGDNFNILSLLNIATVEEHSVSQGYLIELNDMNGKVKSQFNYAEDKSSPISGVEYFYNVNDSGKLDNSIQTVGKDGAVSEAMIGVDYDVNNDFRRKRTLNVSGTINVNVNTSLVGLFPFPIPLIYPSASVEHSTFKSVVTTKIINRIGLLKEVVAFEDGASVSTENMLWDRETGEVLMTKTKNEYGDYIYNLNLPAHWTYDQMGQAYKNIGVSLNNFQYVSGAYQRQNGSVDYFVPGDVVKVNNGSTDTKGWVLTVDEVSNKITLIDKNGDLLVSPPPQDKVTITIMESGRTNQQSLAVGSLTMKKNPINASTLTNDRLSSLENDILNASAMEYSDEWSVQKGEEFNEGDLQTVCGIIPGDTINPFVSNLRGAYRPFRSFVKLGDRIQHKSVTGILNKRSQGAYEDFVYFWQNPNNGDDWVATPNSDNIGAPEWTWQTTITPFVGYDQNGVEQENKDALYRYSSAIYGYKDKLPIAVAANASKGQIAFDGFEDYDFYQSDGCKKRHFSFENTYNKITNEESHTGDYSALIYYGGSWGIYSTRILATEPCDDANLGFPSSNGVNYEVSDCELYNLFGPETYDRTAYEKSLYEGASTPVLNSKTTKYLVSYWVKKKNASINDNDFSVLYPTIEVDNQGVSLSDFRMSSVIDGWQKLEYTFEIPGFNPTSSGEKRIEIGFEYANNQNEEMYVDDFRIQPYNSSMKTYVYSAQNFRLVAELDDNNFATFYEYNKEGKLLRVKKETEKGIQTIQESREHTSTQ